MLVFSIINRFLMRYAGNSFRPVMGGMEAESCSVVSQWICFIISSIFPFSIFSACGRSCFPNYFYCYVQVGDAVLRDYIFVHLSSNHDKFNLLMLVTTTFLPTVSSSIFHLSFGTGPADIVSNYSFMLQKLFALVDSTAAPDNPDALVNQEVLQPGHLITIYLKVT